MTKEETLEIKIPTIRDNFALVECLEQLIIHFQRQKDMGQNDVLRAVDYFRDEFAAQ